MKKQFLLGVCMALTLLTVACSQDTETANDPLPTDEKEKLEQPQEAEKTETEDESEEDSDEASELGDMEVKIYGEAVVSDDGIKVEGKSNLLPGMRISSRGVNDAGFASIPVQGVTDVREDGSFTFNFDPLGNDTVITLSLYKNSQAEEHYGEQFVNVTGPQKYMTSTHGEYEVKVEFEVDVDRERPYTIPIDIPNWDEKPDDYGQPNVWMEVEVDSDHRYLYFRGKSNLMEGSSVGGNLRQSSGVIAPFSYDFTRVNPDGSFELRVPYHSLLKGMYMPIAMEPNRNSWDDVVSAYGEKGENFEGDLVVKGEDEQYIELIVPLDAPDFDPPEDVGLTVEEEEVKILMPDHLLFDFDESVLKAEAQETLDNIIADLNKLDENTNIQINGHTDNVGDSSYNLKLSEERAQSVWEYLKGNAEMDKFNVKIKGYGDQQPVASNEDEDGQQRNRRVEIVINPK